MLKPKTWQEVEIALADAKGYYRGLLDGGAQEDSLIALNVYDRITALSVLRPCDACQGSGMDYESDKSYDCSICDDSGIAPEEVRDEH